MTRLLKNRHPWVRLCASGFLASALVLMTPRAHGLTQAALPNVELRAMTGTDATEVWWNVAGDHRFAAFELQRRTEGADYETVAHLAVDDPFTVAEHGARATDIRFLPGTEVVYRLRGLTPLNEWIDFAPARVCVEGPAPAMTSSEPVPPLEHILPMAAPGTGTGALVRIAVTTGGLYRVSAEDLSARLSGWSTGVVALALASTNFSITAGGEPVAWFPDGDGLLFYGEGTGSRYTATNVYWLAPGPGLAMAARSGTAPAPTETNRTFSSALHFEQDTPSYWDRRVYTNATDDFWVWDFGIAPATRTFYLDLPSADPAAGPASFSIDLKGYFQQAENFTNHHVRMSVNGVVIADGLFAGFEHMTLTGTATNFTAGTNTVAIDLLKDPGVSYSQVLIEAFDVAFPRLLEADDEELLFVPGGAPELTVNGFAGAAVRVFDVSAPKQPVLLEAVAVDLASNGLYRASFEADPSSNRYFAVANVREPAAVDGVTPADLAATTNRADHLIITVPGFASTAEVLAAHRRSQGLESRVVTTEDIYAGFSHGLATPDALRAFLAHALQHWAKPPRWVALAGAGTLDYRRKNSTRADDACLVPPALTWISDSDLPGAAFDGEWVAVDNPLADIDGDAVIDVAIGRLPAASAGELAGMIDKTLAYELDGAWKWDVMLLADNTELYNAFDQACEDLRQRISPDYLAVTNYLSPDVTNANPAVRAAEIARVKTALTNGLNNGLGLLVYMGHGTYAQLASEQLLAYSGATDDIARLVNTNRPAILIAATCEMANFCLPLSSSSSAKQCLGEHMVKRPGVGMAAVWASATISYTSVGLQLCRAVFHAWYDDHEPRFGTAVRRALEEYGQAPSVPYLLRTMVLLGDPATALAPPDFAYAAWRTSSFTPGELADPDISGPGADPDGDGRYNLAEFFQDTEPKLMEQAPELAPVITTEGTNAYAGAVFRRIKWREGAIEIPEVSWDLPAGAWSNGTDVIEWVSTNRVDQRLEDVQFRLKIPLAPFEPVFLRMRYEEVP